jgi:hypothetical protein
MINELSLTAKSPDAAGTSASTETLAGLGRFERITIDADLQGATGGALDVLIQRFCGGQWRDWLRFAQVAAGAAKHYTYVLSESEAITEVGVSTSPVIVAGAKVGGLPGDKIRFLFIAGSGTSAGANQTVIVTGFRR